MAYLQITMRIRILPALIVYGLTLVKLAVVRVVSQSWSPILLARMNLPIVVKCCPITQL